MNILFVCTGNTCRSAMAEGLLKKIAADKGVRFVSARSCGTAASTLYRVPRQVLALMDREGVDLRAHKSTQVNTELVHAADLIFVMENFQREYITLCFPDVRKKIFLFKEFIQADGGKEVPDPMGHSDEMYAETARAIREYTEKLVALICAQGEALTAGPREADQKKTNARKK